MPYTAEDKKSAITRLRRIQGQALALEKAVEAGTPCSALLQQLSALRGATNRLMAEVLESNYELGTRLFEVIFVHMSMIKWMQRGLGTGLIMDLNRAKLG